MTSSGRKKLASRLGNKLKRSDIAVQIFKDN